MVPASQALVCPGNFYSFLITLLQYPLFNMKSFLTPSSSKFLLFQGSPNIL